LGRLGLEVSHTEDTITVGGKTIKVFADRDQRTFLGHQSRLTLSSNLLATSQRQPMPRSTSQLAPKR